MKKMYEKPMAFEEAFVADEYVAACYFLACERGSNGWTGNADKWGGVREYGYGVSHSPLGTSHTCGDKTANRVITDNGGVFEKVQEHNGQQGWISGTYCGYDDNDHILVATPISVPSVSKMSTNRNEKMTTMKFTMPTALKSTLKH